MSPTTRGDRRRTRRVAARPVPVPRPVPRQHHANTRTADDPDPASTNPPGSAERLRRISAARTAVEESNAELRAAVRAAREAGDSWATIGATLETARTTIHRLPRQPDSPRPVPRRP
jgi:hypothetical protein